MENAKTIESGGTLSDLLEMPAEVKDLVHGIAAAALEAGRASEAEKVLEGLVAIHPRDPANWALLARAHLRTGKELAARFAAEVGRQLAPDEPSVRLAHAEVLLGAADGRTEALGELRGLAGMTGPVGERAAALLAGLGERVSA
ncbi:MAG TPA: tetratricopeptide repeat protein [Anaeromyxobacteraceae bacterium]|nr:tetratricopeptide repeat protein [Anaeromyxobacteraceae bacterium]